MSKLSIELSSQFSRLPFGVQSGPALLQSAVERLFRGLIGTTTFLFMDDILSSSPNFATHLKDLKAVLDRLSSWYATPVITLSVPFSLKRTMTDASMSLHIVPGGAPEEVKDLQRKDQGLNRMYQYIAISLEVIKDSTG